MRVILAGQKSFGAAVHEMLENEGHDIAGVWSPVEHVGRDKLTTLAFNAHRIDSLHGDYWMHPQERTPFNVKALEADLIVAAHSHDFIGRDTRAATRLGGVGYHPSLLPRHRGRDAVRWTLHLGDPIAGGSVYWLTDNVDGGPIAAQDLCHVRPDDDPSTLWRRELFPIGISLLARVLRDLDNGCIVELPQDEAVATWEPSWDRPPLHRPELPQIGSVNGFKHITSREALR